MHTTPLHGIAIPAKTMKVLGSLNKLERGWNIIAFYKEARSLVMINQFQRSLESQVNLIGNGAKLYRRFRKQKMQSMGILRNEQNILENLFPGIYSEPGWPKIYVTSSNSSQEIQTLVATHGPIGQEEEEAILYYIGLLNRGGE